MFMYLKGSSEYLLRHLLKTLLTYLWDVAVCNARKVTQGNGGFLTLCLLLRIWHLFNTIVRWYQAM